MLARAIAVLSLVAVGVARAAPLATGAPDALPEGPGRALVARTCGTGCHGLEVVTHAPRPSSRWAAIVDDMVTRGASGSEAELDAVLAYLVQNFGIEDGGPSAPSRAAAAAATAAPSSARAREPPLGPPRLDLVRYTTGWPTYGYDAGGTRHSPLEQITPANVAGLRLAWRWDAREATAPPGAPPRASQMTPLVVGNVMFLTTPYGVAVALDPTSGREFWRHELRGVGLPARRGLAFWPGDDETPPRLFFGTTAGKLVALDARTGGPVPEFGSGGVVDLRKGCADAYPDAHYGVTSPPVVYRDLVITGAQVQEHPARGPAGDVRAWDARTGRLVWRFHTVPRPGEYGHETWEGDGWRERSGVNAWGPMTLDEEGGLVFVPLGSPAYDFHGGDRPGANLFGSSLVVLDADTGERRWHFQTTHHDLWDSDVPAGPTLVQVRRDERTIAAAAQVTKQGLLFVLERETGAPLHGVEERPVPQDGFLPGERPWPTQPFPRAPPPLARNAFAPHELASLAPEHRRHCEALLARDGPARTGGPYLPIGPRPSVHFPGMLGGANWHGGSFDPRLGYLFVNTQSLGDLLHLPPPSDGSSPIAYRTGFWDESRLWPCQKPPWGELMAIALDTGAIAWRVPLGEFPALAARGVPPTGTPNLGGTISTASGLVFVGATVDGRFRAFDARSGRELWSVDLGAAAHAVPITYLGSDGRQYVAVMASGGGLLGSPLQPPTLYAFALP